GSHQALPVGSEGEPVDAARSAIDPITERQTTPRVVEATGAWVTVGEKNSAIRAELFVLEVGLRDRRAEPPAPGGIAEATGPGIDATEHGRKTIRCRLGEATKGHVGKLSRASECRAGGGSEMANASRRDAVRARNHLPKDRHGNILLVAAMRRQSSAA